MITFLIVFGSVLVYFLIGALYARSRLVPIYRRIEKGNSHWSTESYRQYWIRQELGMAMAPRIAFWPIAAPFDFIAGPGANWFMAPVREREERITQLRKDAKFWRGEAKTEMDAKYRDMAKQLAQSFEEQAKELESS